MNYNIEELSSAWKGHRLFAEWLVTRVNPEVTVDLGVDYGYSLFCLANPKIGTVYGIDSFEGDIHAGHHPDAYDKVLAVIEQNSYDNIKVIKGFFDDVAVTWDKPIDILHIDGLHTYEAAMNDYQTWREFLTPNSVIIMHDTTAFKEVKRVFEDIDLPKMKFNHSAGLGVLSANKELIDEIVSTWSI
jgi:hypothetical protein